MCLKQLASFFNSLLYLAIKYNQKNHVLSVIVRYNNAEKNKKKILKTRVYYGCVSIAKILTLKNSENKNHKTIDFFLHNQ